MSAEPDAQRFWLRNALTAALVVGVFVGAPVLIMAYPEMRRVDAIPEWRQLLPMLVALTVGLVALAWLKRNRR